MQPYRTGFTFLLSFGAAAVAQSLAACAQGCVGATSSTCKATDYSCACSSAGYILELTACIERECGFTQLKEAYQFLKDLCNEVGSPLEKGWKDMDSGGERLELREDTSFVVASITTFQDTTTFHTTTFHTTAFQDTTTFQDTSTFTKPETRFTPNTTPIRPSTTSGAGAASTRASASGTTASTASTGLSSSGLSTGAKVGIGLGVPLAVLIIGGLVGLAYWLGRRKKTPAPNPQPEMIDPNTRHHAVEMPTKANMAEMPASEWTGGMRGQGVGPAELPERR